MISSAVVGASDVPIMRVGQSSDKFGRREGFIAATGLVKYTQVGQNTLAKEVSSGTTLGQVDTVSVTGNLTNSGYVGDATETEPVHGYYQTHRFGDQEYLILAYNLFIVSVTLRMIRIDSETRDPVLTGVDNSVIPQDTFTSVTTDIGTFRTADATHGSNFDVQFVDRNGDQQLTRYTDWTWNTFNASSRIVEHQEGTTTLLHNIQSVIVDGKTGESIPTDLSHIGETISSNLGHDDFSEALILDARQPLILSE